MNHLKGMHHVTAITSSAEENYKFFTYVLGMRLVKKTVNQDDIQTYHLFFADDVGGAGTDMTFFDFPGIPKGTHGTNEIYRTAFRVPTDAALDYWVKRFDRLDVKHDGIQEQFGVKVLSFVDFDDQQYQMISDENNKGIASGTPWQKGPVPLEYAITGLGPIHIRIAEFDYMKEVLEKVLLFKEIGQEGDLHLFEVGEGGNGAQVIVEKNDRTPSRSSRLWYRSPCSFPCGRPCCTRRMDKTHRKLRLPNIRFRRSLLLRIVILQNGTGYPFRICNRRSRLHGRRTIRNTW